jgi:uncharacterized protein (TIGR02117 family)
MKRVAFFSLILYAITIVSTSGQNTNPVSDESVDSRITIYLVSRGYHTGILVPVQPAVSTIKVLQKYTCGYAEFGWGEAHYYQSTNPGCSDTLGALFMPNRSVIRLEILQSGPGYSLSRSNFAIKFTLSESQFRSMCMFIENSFTEKKQEPVIESTEKGGAVTYYSSIHTYHLFNTCNTWAAKTLASGGIEIDPTGIISAYQLYQNVKDSGSIIKR